MFNSLENRGPRAGLLKKSGRIVLRLTLALMASGAMLGAAAAHATQSPLVLVGRSGGDDYTSIYNMDQADGGYVSKKSLFSDGHDNEVKTQFGLAFDPAGQMWLTGRSSGDDYATLYKINEATGSYITKVTLFGYPTDNETRNPFDIAFDSNGTLWAVGRASGDDWATLYKLDPSTGQASFKVTLFGYPTDNETANEFDIAFAPDGSLWASGRSGGDDYTSLYLLNPQTGQASFKTTLFGHSQAGESKNGIDIAFGADGTLWGTGRASGDQFATLYRIDTSTGLWLDKLTLFGNGLDNETAFDFDIAFRPQTVVAPDPGVSAVPEPATWAMLIAGFGLVGAASRRRRERPEGTLC